MNVRTTLALIAAVAAMASVPGALEAQQGPSLSGSVEAQIQDFYQGQAPAGAKALPPGIRKNLARGRPMPPGIAKRSPPPELVAQVDLPGGYELMEVGLDVVLVEAATGIIHDVLMDVIR